MVQPVVMMYSGFMSNPCVMAALDILGGFDAVEIHPTPNEAPAKPGSVMLATSNGQFHSRCRYSTIVKPGDEHRDIIKPPEAQFARAVIALNLAYALEMLAKSQGFRHSLLAKHVVLHGIEWPRPERRRKSREAWSTGRRAHARRDQYLPL